MRDLRVIRKVTEKNVTDYIIMYECESIVEEQTIELFSYLIKSGRAFKLQGHYGRYAQYLIDNNIVNSKGVIL